MKDNNIKIHILGSCSGTEPYPQRHHTSVAIETNTSLYWLDAGEGCSYTAHLKGIDLLKTKAIFISHNHMDHIGGLGNLLWTIRKLCVFQDRETRYPEIQTILPYVEAYDGIMKLLSYTEGNFKCKHSHSVQAMNEGVIYEDTSLNVTAIHNNHLPCDNSQGWKSFSFQVKLGEKVILYTGDYEDGDLESILPEQCSLLLVETGHHKLETIYEELQSSNKTVEKICFVHHGLYILNHLEEAEQKVRHLWGSKAFISKDGQTITL